MSSERRGKTKERGYGYNVVLSLITLLLAVCGFLLYDSNTRIETSEYELKYDALPKEFDGFRIAELSDIHTPNDAAKIIAATAAAEPDIIAITGDIIDEKYELAAQLENAGEIIDGLKLTAPVYFVTGNHDWASGGMHELLSLLEAKGVSVLRNDYALLSRGAADIILAGTDDPNGPADMEKPAELIRRIQKNEGDKFITVLEHRNNNLTLYSELGVPLVICGHAHGGVIRLPFTDGIIGPNRKLFPSHTNGVYGEGGTSLVVSRGLGNHTGFPRFLNNPHIPVIILRSKP
jgi:predicted MPP superfamily phosphohydrolase